MIDIEKFICSLLADHPAGVTVRGDIHKALKDQGLEYKGGKIVSIEDKISLPESEDERIRKYLTSFVELNSGVNLPPEDAKKILGWIDKQGERKPTDKVEPKFKVGDKIRKKSPRSFDKDMQVARIKKDYYICNHIGKFSSEVVLFSKESSYELIEQKPTWSEEDKRKMDRIYSILRQATDTHAFSTTCRLIGDAECIELQDFLKSLRGRVGCEANCATMWKPSDGQMAALMSVASGFEVTEKTKEPLKELFVELKKLREE